MLVALAVCTPAIAMILLRLRHDGIQGVRGAFRPITAWSIGASWWVVTLLLAPLLVGVPYSVYLAFGGIYRPSPLFALFDQPTGLVVL